MSNTFLTISMITNECLRILENSLTFTKGVNRQFDDQFAKSGAKIGDTLNIRKPPRYVGRSGAALSVEDYTDTSFPLALQSQFGVDIQFTSADMALKLDDFSARYIKPAVATVANKIDRDGLALYKKVYNSIGTPGTIPSTLETYLNAGALLAENACPQDDLRSLVLAPRPQAKIVNALTTFFNPTKEIARQYEEGNMGRAIGFKWSMDQNIVSHTAGTQAGTPLVNGAAQTGASLITDGWTASSAILKEGDIFTIAGVFAVNPQSRQTTGQLQQFIATADATASGGGAATISISPSIVTSGAFQTVDASPADNAVITPLYTSGQQSPQNMAYHRDAFVLGCADLPLPGGVDMAARVSDPQLGMSVRMVRAYDINNDRFPCRLDILYGWAPMYASLACRIQS